MGNNNIGMMIVLWKELLGVILGINIDLH